MRYKCSTKWNDVYKCNDYTLIYNRVTNDIKIKNNRENEQNS